MEIVLHHDALVEHRLAAPSHGSWLHWYSVLLIAAALFSVVTGAAFTTNEERPLYSFGQIHAIAGAAVGILTFGLVVLLPRVEEHAWLRRLAWISLAMVVVEALLGFPAISLTPAVRFAHAALAQLFFAATVLIAVITSRSWGRLPVLAAGRPWLRILANITLVTLLAQEALGVAFRHGILGAVLHVLGALVASILVVVLAMSVIYRDLHEPLSPFGVILLVITAVQVFLGVGLLTISSSDVDPTAVITVAVVHAATAALTFAATVVMAAVVWHSVPARAKESAGSSSQQAVREYSRTSLARTEE